MVAEVVIDSIGARGDGVAVIDGVKVFTPFTAPGDSARIAYRGERGEIAELIEPSPVRAAPLCPYYGACGGCALQHVTREFYRDWKRQLVVDGLAREGFDSGLVAPIVECAPASRRRASFAVRRTGDGVILGYTERASARIIAIEQCPVLHPGLERALPCLRDLAAAAPPRWRGFDLNVTLCDNGLDVVFTGGDAADDLTGPENLKLIEAGQKAGAARVTVSNEVVAMFTPPVVHFGGVAVVVPPGGFLQASAEGEAALVNFVTQNTIGPKRIADLFCGSGAFSLPLARAAAVDAFDSDKPAIAALDAAARSAGLRYPLHSHQRNLFERPLNVEELKAFDAVVFDPPRAGARAQAQQLAQSAVPVVVGVSCNPASFARDAAILREGEYRLSQVLPVDQFVFSPHVELAGLFTKG